MRHATAQDVAEIVRLLAAHDIAVSSASLAGRVAGDDSGVLIADGACVSWTVEPGVLHVYDVAGDAAAIGAIVDELNRIADAAFCAVMSATVYHDHPLLGALLENGFAIDFEEADARDGAPHRLLGLVREVA
jgi:hypothetical protein